MNEKKLIYKIIFFKLFKRISNYNILELSIYRYKTTMNENMNPNPDKLSIKNNHQAKTEP